jgi:hypothetical protein
MGGVAATRAPDLSLGSIAHASGCRATASAKFTVFDGRRVADHAASPVVGYARRGAICLGALSGGRAIIADTVAATAAAARSGRAASGARFRLLAAPGDFLGVFGARRWRSIGNLARGARHRDVARSQRIRAWCLEAARATQCSPTEVPESTALIRRYGGRCAISATPVEGRRGTVGDARAAAAAQLCSKVMDLALETSP